MSTSGGQGQGRRAAGLRPARGRRRRRRPAPAARGDRRELRGVDQRGGPRAPAPAADRRAALPRTVQRQLARGVPAGRAARLSRGVPLAAAGDRARPRSGRLPRGPRLAARHAARGHARRPGPAGPGARPQPDGGARRHGPGAALGPDANLYRGLGPAAGDAWSSAPPTTGRPPARPIGAVAGKRIRKVYKRHRGDGARDRALQPRRGLPRAAQEGQGAALPPGAVRGQAVRRGGGGAASSSRSRPCRTCSGATRTARCRSRCCAPASRRWPRCPAAAPPAWPWARWWTVCASTSRPPATSSPSASPSSPPKTQRALVRETFV